MSVDPSGLRRIVAGVVALAAALLVIDIALAALVARRAREIGGRLDHLRETTADLRRVPEINRTLERMRRSLEAIRRGQVG